MNWSTEILPIRAYVTRFPPPAAAEPGESEFRVLVVGARRQKFLRAGSRGRRRPRNPAEQKEFIVHGIFVEHQRDVDAAKEEAAEKRVSATPATPGTHVQAADKS